METRPRRWSDEWVEELIGNLLRIGVLVAAGVTLIGAIFYLARHGGETPSYHLFRGEPARFRSVRQIVADLGALSGRSIIQFGLLLLVATPIARVAFSLAAFALQRDRTYVILTLIVLVVLIYSLLGLS